MKTLLPLILLACLSASAGEQPVAVRGTNGVARGLTLAGVVTNASGLRISGTIIRTNYTTGIYSIESAAGHFLYPTNSGTPNISINANGNVAFTGIVSGNGAGLTNLSFLYMTPPGSSTWVGYNSNGIWSAETVFNYNPTNDTLSVPNLILSGTLEVPEINIVNFYAGSLNVTNPPGIDWLSDVTMTAEAAGHGIGFSGTQWTNGPAIVAAGFNGNLTTADDTLQEVAQKLDDLVVGGTDADAIHDNVSGEINAVADKATPVAGDHLLIEDSAASNAKKDITIGSQETALEGVMDLQDLQGLLLPTQLDLSAFTDTHLLYNNAGVIGTIPQTSFSPPVSDTAFGVSWDGVTTIAGSKNATVDWGKLFDTDYDGLVNALDATFTGGAGTLAGHLIFGTDNTYDIGASSATRPRSVYVGTAGTFGTAAGSTALNLNQWGLLHVSAPGKFVFRDHAGDPTTYPPTLQLGGTTASFPSIKRNGTAINFRLADDSADANITCAGLTLSGAITFPDNIRQTFNPGANAAGFNFGAHTADPDTPVNGDGYYNSTANELRARINGAWVALGAGGAGGGTNRYYEAGEVNHWVELGGTNGDPFTVKGASSSTTVSNWRISNNGNITTDGNLTATGNLDITGTATIDQVMTLGDQLSVAGETTIGAGGVNADGGGLKHGRVTTGSIGAGATALVTVTWGTTFADANYTVTASVLDSTTSSLSLSVVHVESITASAVTVRVLNNAIGSLTGTVHCIGIHD